MLLGQSPRVLGCKTLINSLGIYAAAANADTATSAAAHPRTDSGQAQQRHHDDSYGHQVDNTKEALLYHDESFYLYQQIQTVFTGLPLEVELLHEVDGQVVSAQGEWAAC